jgi:UDP-2,3-diacylglucosamine hydrolase
MNFYEFNAPPAWQRVDFISDLHLKKQEPDTFQAWLSYLANVPTDALFILGDLFEVWVGDDCLQDGSFEQICVKALCDTAARIPVHVMHGNRDFLLGDAFMQTSGCTFLPDPTVITLGDTRWLLTHGDSLCIEDKDYQNFRGLVRSPAWQLDFLSKPLNERKTIAQGIRAKSEAQKRTVAYGADVDLRAALDLLKAANAKHMIHGHTHLPFDHQMPEGAVRLVLSDWELGTSRPRAEVLRLERTEQDGWTQRRLAPTDASKRED